VETTLYNNNTPIPLITDASLWLADVTGAMCYYNNNSNNA